MTVGSFSPMLIYFTLTFPRPCVLFVKKENIITLKSAFSDLEGSSSEVSFISYVVHEVQNNFEGRYVR